jgi:anti-sigma regulatory factor (Ser/Thr protein kinase)
VRVTLPSGHQAPGLARQATRDALVAWRLAHVAETAVLIMSELVTNAVRHARGTDAIGLGLERTGTRLRIEVQDADACWPRLRVPGQDDDSGFGCVLVDALADNWGVRETATGKAVWAELDTRPAAGKVPPQAAEQSEQS